MPGYMVSSGCPDNVQLKQLPSKEKVAEDKGEEPLFFSSFGGPI